MAIKSHAAFVAIMAPRPFADDLVEAMAMRLWRETCLLIEVRDETGQRWSVQRRADAVLYDLPLAVQDEMRAIAVSLLWQVCGAFNAGGDADVLSRLRQMSAHLDALDRAEHAPSESGEVGS